ncbi:NUDIX hydrolase [Streptomyces sannanensis]|uniref:NUDIX hydrolase n=1 Tax=Streptomyces sannanensis TaxID=285536 RepID=A0ABP6S3Q9_9ACTN
MTSAWLPPEQYIETIARATSYACLYFTDTAGHPFQMRSRNKREIWQWPGGNLESGETPWDGARRECLEETGYDFRGPQKLIGVHFITAGTAWPANHIGFIFDGGHLSDDQLSKIKLTDEHTEWQVKPLDGWRREMSPVNFARLDAINTARRTGTVAYLER